MIRRTIWLLSIAASALFATAVRAQVSDFSGTWMIDAGKTAEANPTKEPPVGRGSTGANNGALTIIMDARSVRITRTRPGHDLVSTYRLDGSESRNVIPVTGAPDLVQVSTAKWHRDTLVITTREQYGDAITKYSMDHARLKVESSYPLRPAVQTPRTPPGVRFSNTLSQTTVVYSKR